MTKENIKSRLSELFFSEQFIEKFVDKMTKEGVVWFNSFNPPFADKERINQFLGQSAFIRFGDALEAIINEIIMENGFSPLQRKIQSDNYPGKKNKKLDYDVIVSKESIAFVAEIKIRDNHDSTKKTGQAEDLERKIRIAQETYPNLHFTGIAFYIDNSMLKNGENIVELINSRNDFTVLLAYGSEFFDILGIPLNEWEIFEESVLEWSSENRPMMNIYARHISENIESMKSRILAKFTAQKISQSLYEKLMDVIDEYAISDN